MLWRSSDRSLVASSTIASTRRLGALFGRFQLLRLALE